MATQLDQTIIQQIIHGQCDNIFAYLGVHNQKNTRFVRTFLPNAKSVTIKNKQNGKALAKSVCLHDAGFFEASCSSSDMFDYYLTVEYENQTIDIEDPYCYPSTISEHDLYLFAEGTHESAYHFLGAHIIECCGEKGTRFAVWAPNARSVAVVGDFNFWHGAKHTMRKLLPSGVWEIFIPHVSEGSIYKYHIIDSHGKSLPHRADPYGFSAQKPPEQASKIVGLKEFEWTDQKWIQQGNPTARNKPVSIYEVHLGSWKRKDNTEYLSYEQLAHDLIEYVSYMGFTHIQLMPISEYPFDGSWGYQPVGLFAPTSRFGEPCDFKYFINACHNANIAVLIDWVPGHFPSDSHGLGQFDGTPLYEHADKRQGFHPDWNTYIYNYGRNEIKSFLLSNAIFWFDQFHIDGLRVDAVASMLYLDYSREEGEWLPNRFGGRENLDAIDVLRLVNSRVYKNFPNAVMIAEESTAWPGVSSPVDAGGLGFGYKWNMGWMNDSLSYIEKDAIHKKYHHHEMTFSLHYAFSENFVLPLSHDEVVHGKGSMINKMPGDHWQKHANLRAYYAFMWGHPGKKLVFMGSEFAQSKEWDHNHSLCWHETKNDNNKNMQALVIALNNLYTQHSALYELDCDGNGFEWNEADDTHNSVFAFTRRDKSGASLLFICNFTPAIRENYIIGVKEKGCYQEILNTDSAIFSGSNIGNKGAVSTQEIARYHYDHSLTLTLPPLATLVFKVQ